MNIDAIIQRVYESRSVVGHSGKRYELHSEVDQEEGEFLFQIINTDPAITRTLEVGCAYGLSSLHICRALQGRAGASHTIIDPYQTTDWHGVGVGHLVEAEIDFFRLIEVKSEFALPQLLQNCEGSFDFVFVDGWHTFDHTLLDCFYATRLLKVGGYLAIDDTDMPSVRRVVSYLSNYPCYAFSKSLSEPRPKTWKRTIAQTAVSPLGRGWLRQVLSHAADRRLFEEEDVRMVAFRKVSHDQRSWNWHDDVF